MKMNGIGGWRRVENKPVQHQALAAGRVPQRGTADATVELLGSRRRYDTTNNDENNKTTTTRTRRKKKGAKIQEINGRRGMMGWVALPNAVGCSCPTPPFRFICCCFLLLLSLCSLHLLCSSCVVVGYVAVVVVVCLLLLLYVPFCVNALLLDYIV
jgi:Flp pilus assembly protein TadB